jgi:hypothetical protein
MVPSPASELELTCSTCGIKKRKHCASGKHVVWADTIRQPDLSDTVSIVQIGRYKIAPDLVAQDILGAARKQIVPDIPWHLLSKALLLLPIVLNTPIVGVEDLMRCLKVRLSIPKRIRNVS